MYEIINERNTCIKMTLKKMHVANIMYGLKIKVKEYHIYAKNLYMQKSIYTWTWSGKKSIYAKKLCMQKKEI